MLTGLLRVFGLDVVCDIFQLVGGAADIRAKHWRTCALGKS